MSKAATFAGMGLGTALLASAVAGAAERPATVFDLFDRGVTSIVAASSCGIEDKAEFARFTADFPRVAGAVEAELQKMNPERTSDELALVIGFRLAHLELAAERAVAQSGCQAPEVKRMRVLFDVGEKLAQLPEGSAFYRH